MTPVLRLDDICEKYRRGDEQPHVLVDFDIILHTGDFVVVNRPAQWWRRKRRP
jgi:hypothetical protein